jgi:hypothetical protein
LGGRAGSGGRRAWGAELMDVDTHIPTSSSCTYIFLCHAPPGSPTLPAMASSSTASLVWTTSSASWAASRRAKVGPYLRPLGVVDGCGSEFMYQLLSSMPRSQLSSLQRRIAPLLQFDVVGVRAPTVSLRPMYAYAVTSLYQPKLLSRYSPMSHLLHSSHALP